MTVNRYTFSLNAIGTGTTATTINIPVSLEYQQVDNAELIEKEFVEVEVEKSINPILDYDKARFIPVDLLGVPIKDVVYGVSVLENGAMATPTTYATLGFNDEDILIGRTSFKNSHLYLRFYDTDNNLNQAPITDSTIYSMITNENLNTMSGGSNMLGKPKPANQIPVKYTLSSPILSKSGFAEGYHIYDYKSKYVANLPQFIYMRASLLNAKTGKITNLVTTPLALKIDDLVKKLYTRYSLVKNNTGFYYHIDPTYSNNVNYLLTPNGNNVNINLYQIQSL